MCAKESVMAADAPGPYFTLWSWTTLTTIFTCSMYIYVTLLTALFRTRKMKNLSTRQSLSGLAQFMLPALVDQRTEIDTTTRNRRFAGQGLLNTAHQQILRGTSGLKDVSLLMMFEIPTMRNTMWPLVDYTLDSLSLSRLGMRF